MSANTDDPAFPRTTAYEHPDRYDSFREITTDFGLSKRELTCILCRVPATGDADLDAIIARAERRDVAARAMQGLLAAPDLRDAQLPRRIVEASVVYANNLLAELAKAPESGAP